MKSRWARFLFAAIAIPFGTVPTPPTSSINAFSSIVASNFDAMAGVKVENAIVENFSPGQHLQYSKVDFGLTPPTSFSASVAVPRESAGQKIEIHVDKVNGPLLGTLILKSTGALNRYEPQTAELNPNKVTGAHEIFLVAKGNKPTGNLYSFVFSNQAPAQQKAAMVLHLAPASTKFYIVGKDIIDPDGNKFYPVGANVGLSSDFDWKGTSVGHSADALAWGWNTIRLTTYCSDSPSWTTKATKGYDTLLTQIDSVITEYTSKKLVVILECHDMTGNATVIGNTAKQVDQFWLDAAKRYKDNPYVWFNPLNEPVWKGNESWIEVQKHYLDLIRGTGAENIFIADVMNMGQDAGWESGKKVFDPSMGPSLANGQCNVMFSLHAYGGLGTEDNHIEYFNQVQSSNLALIVGEVGYSINGTSTAGDYESNVRGTEAVFKHAPLKGIGILYWHGTHGDGYSLKTTGGAFYEGGPDENLSPAGILLWNLGHKKPNLGVFQGNLSASNCASARK